MFIKNRVGRIVEVPEDLGLYMVKCDGAVVYEPEIKEEKKDNPLECPYCGKVCANQLGFKKHTEACKKKVLSSQS